MNTEKAAGNVIKKQMLKISAFALALLVSCVIFTQLSCSRLDDYRCVIFYPGKDIKTDKEWFRTFFDIKSNFFTRNVTSVSACHTSTLFFIDCNLSLKKNVNDFYLTDIEIIPGGTISEIDYSQNSYIKASSVYFSTIENATSAPVNRMLDSLPYLLKNSLDTSTEEGSFKLEASFSVGCTESFVIRYSGYEVKNDEKVYSNLYVYSEKIDREKRRQEG